MAPKKSTRHFWEGRPSFQAATLPVVLVLAVLAVQNSPRTKGGLLLFFLLKGGHQEVGPQFDFDIFKP